MRRTMAAAATAWMVVGTGVQTPTQTQPQTQTQTPAQLPTPPAGVAGVVDGLSLAPVTDGLYLITGAGGNIAVRVTGDSVVLVDGGAAEHHDAILELVATVTDQPVRYVVGTHHHDDHMGGNLPMSRHARLVAHEHARDRMLANAQPAPPHLVFTERTTLFVGGAAVEVHHLGGGHTGGDAVVLFPDLDVVHAGDLYGAEGGAPWIDYDNGGSSAGWVAALGGLLALDFETVIPGHGPVATKRDIQTHRDRLVSLRMRVRQLIHEGVPEAAALARLETADLAWTLEPDDPFAARTFAALYAEMTAEAVAAARPASARPRAVR